MKEFLNKRCYLKIQASSQELIFTGIVTSVTESHITFTDKFDQINTFRIIDVIQIKEEKKREEE